MMRYNRPNSSDWIELDGVADLPMRDYIRIASGTFYELRDMLKTLLTGSYLQERDGTTFDLTMTGTALDLTTTDDWERLSVRQVAWLRATVKDALHDEMLDPLA